MLEQKLNTIFLAGFQLEQPAFSFHATILPIFCSSLPKIRQNSILYFSNIPQIKRFQFWYGSCMI
jgi:hypothetical protein